MPQKLPSIRDTLILFKIGINNEVNQNFTVLCLFVPYGNKYLKFRY